MLKSVALERHGYSRLATERQPAGNRCGRVQRNVDIVESRRNGPQLSTRHDFKAVDAGVNKIIAE